MLKTLRKIWNDRWVFRNLPYTIYFNFRHLPFKQACHLPIWLYKPHILRNSGKIIIDCKNIVPGLIRLGVKENSLYPNSGIILENHGGTIIFKGRCEIGNASALSIGKKGTLEFGDRFKATTQFRCVAYNQISFGDRCRFGWDCLVIDTDFHKLKKIDGGYTKGFGSIKMGSDNWIGTRCFVLKNTETSDYCIISGGTKVSGKFISDKRVIIGSPNTVAIQKEGYWRDIFDDVIDY